MALQASPEAAASAPSQQTIPLLSIAFEIRDRVYHFYFSKPILAIWEIAQGPGMDSKGNERRVDFGADEESLQFAETYKQSPGLSSGWVEDYGTLLRLCRQTNMEARSVLGRALNLKFLWGASPLHRFPSVLQLYLVHIREVTLLVSDQYGYKAKLPAFYHPHTLPNLKVVKLTLTEEHKIIYPRDPCCRHVLIHDLLGDLDSALVDSAQCNPALALENGY